MPRNAEVIRQWSILRDLESSRRVTIDELADRTGVTTRTIRRDLEALQSSGFPLYDEVVDGKRYWMLEQRAFSGLDDTGFTLAELSALYFSRTLVEALASTPFHADLKSGFEKLAGALTPGMRQFLDRLPLVLQAKPGPGRTGHRRERRAEGARSAAGRSTRAAQLVDATLHHRRGSMRYHSMSSDREKAYAIDPVSPGSRAGQSLRAGVRTGYGQLRTFAVDRIQGLSLTEERFDPSEVPEEAFAIRWASTRERHRSASRLPSPRPSRVMSASASGIPRRPPRTDRTAASPSSLHVSNDRALSSWILGFGPLARVLSPPELVEQVVSELERARELEPGRGAAADAASERCERATRPERAGAAASEGAMSGSPRGDAPRMRLKIQPVRPLHEEHVASPARRTRRRCRCGSRTRRSRASPRGPAARRRTASSRGGTPSGGRWWCGTSDS